MRNFLKFRPRNYTCILKLAVLMSCLHFSIPIILAFIWHFSLLEPFCYDRTRVGHANIKTSHAKKFVWCHAHKRYFGQNKKIWLPSSQMVISCVRFLIYDWQSDIFIARKQSPSKVKCPTLQNHFSWLLWLK